MTSRAVAITPKANGHQGHQENLKAISNMIANEVVMRNSDIHRRLSRIEEDVNSRMAAMQQLLERTFKLLDKAVDRLSTGKLPVAMMPDGYLKK